MATVKELLEQLENGEIDTAGVATEFAFMEWPQAERRSTLDEIEADPDPAIEPDDGFPLVAQAFADGRIDEATYSELAKAHADALA